MYDFGLLNPVWAGTRAAELTSDTAFIQAMLDVETAWCRAQVSCGTAPESILPAITAAGDVAGYDLTAIAARTPDGANALIPLLSDLREKVAANDPAAASYVHRGATSQDIIDTALMLLAVRVGQHALAQLKVTVRQLSDLAQTHATTVMIGRSLDQHAQPISFGYRVAQWIEALGSAGQHFEATLAGLAVQWGGAVGTSTWWVDYFRAEAPETDPMDLVNRQREALATELGLTSASVWHANRIPVISVANAAFQITAAGAKLANDMLTAVQAEHAELAEPTAPGRGGSSAMPHKNNPVLSIRLKNAAQAAAGAMNTLNIGVIANTAERADGGWHTEWAALRDLLRTTGSVTEILAELTAGIEVFPAAMRKNLEIHGAYLMLGRVTTWLAPILEAQGTVPAGQAKARITHICQQAISAGEDPAQALADQLPTGAVNLSAIQKVFDPTGYTGGSATIVAEVNTRYRKWSL